MINPEVTELSRKTFACPSSVEPGGVCGGEKSHRVGKHARQRRNEPAQNPFRWTKPEISSAKHVVHALLRYVRSCGATVSKSTYVKNTPTVDRHIAVAIKSGRLEAATECAEDGERSYV